MTFEVHATFSGTLCWVGEEDGLQLLMPPKTTEGGKGRKALYLKLDLKAERTKEGMHKHEMKIIFLGSV